MVYAENRLSGSSVPAFVDDVLEANFYILADSEKSWNEMFQGIGVSELQSYNESGVEVVYEENKFTEIIGKIKKWFIDLWNKIKAAIDKLLDKIEEKRKEFVKKRIDKVKLEDIKAIDDDKFPKKLKCFVPFDALSLISKYESNAKKILSNINADHSEMVMSTRIDESDFKEKYSAQEVVKTITGGSITTASGATAAIKESLLKEVNADKKWIVSNWNKICDVCIGGKIKKDIKKIQDTNKKVIDHSIKAFDTYKSGKDDTSFVPVITAIKNVASSFSLVTNAVNSSYTSMFKSCSRILLRMRIATMFGKKPEEKKSTNESVSYTGGSISVDSLFNF